MSMFGQFENEEISTSLRGIEADAELTAAEAGATSEHARALEARLIELVAAQKRANARTLISSLSVAALLVTPFAIFAYTTLLDSLSSLLAKPSGVLYVVAPVYFTAIVMMARWMIRMRRKAREVAASIQNSADLSCVGALVDVLTIENKTLRNVAETALTNLLPQIKASDTHLLGQTQKRRLSLVLLRSVDGGPLADALDTTRLRGAHLAEYQIAILKAFEQVGGANEIKLVRRLAEAPAASEAGMKAQEAARQCVVYLQERTEQETAARTLLRGSAAQNASPEQLLRPAGSDSGNQANLVMSSEAPEPDAGASLQNRLNHQLALATG